MNLSLQSIGKNNMDNNLTLKKKFHETFPEQAQLLELAKSQDEINELHSRFVDESKQKTIESVKNSDLSDEDKQKVMTNMKVLKAIPKGVTAVDSMLLMNEKYETLIKAKDHEIENQIHVLLDTLQRLKEFKNSKDKSSSIVAGMVSGGIILFGATLTYLYREYRFNYTLPQALELIFIVPSVLALFIESVLLAVLIPIIYFTTHPSNCIIFLINELDKPLEFSEEYNIHGKPHTITTVIPGVIVVPKSETSPEGETSRSAGFMVSVKEKSAMVGTQYGFTMKCGDTLLSFGVESPLGDKNKCSCEVNTSAKYVAKLMDRTPGARAILYAISIGKDITITIRCNSGSGSTAYYIARAYKTQ